VRRRLLVTTALEQTWGDHEPILFAGEWCRLYDRKAAWSARQHEVLPYHWSDRPKLARDHKYLDELQEKLLTRIAQALNDYHGIERPIRYWRMVLGVWLPTYVAVLFDRWECLRLVVEREDTIDTVALALPPDRAAPDADTFIQQAAYSAEWNHGLFLRIIHFAYADRCALRVKEHTACASQSQESAARFADSSRLRRPAKRALRAAVWKLDALAERISRSYRVTFVTSYFSTSALVRLNLALRQVPRLHLSEFAYQAENLPRRTAAGVISRDLRFKVVFAPSSQFEEFLSRWLSDDIPRACVEDFGARLDQVRAIRIKTKVICSAGAHWHNELFKLWCAEQLLKGTKFVALTHGGAIPVSIDQTMYFDEKVSDRKVTWSIPFLPNHVRLPPNKLVGKRVSSSKTICAVITQETPLHPFRASDGPIGVGVLEVVPLVSQLFAGLHPQIQDVFRVKPYRNLGWNTRQRISDLIGPERIYSGPSYEHCLRQSRLVVCTYPETTFAEAMASGLPTLLLYSPHFWQTIPQLEETLRTLKAAGIVYEDPQRAAVHVNEIWHDADAWWGSKMVLAAREQFMACCLDLDRNWVRRWAGFLRECAA
jgi:putative transferase (TIGR04331 family)